MTSTSLRSRPPLRVPRLAVPLLAPATPTFLPLRTLSTRMPSSWCSVASWQSSIASSEARVSRALGVQPGMSLGRRVVVSTPTTKRRLLTKFTKQLMKCCLLRGWAVLSRWSRARRRLSNYNPLIRTSNNSSLQLLSIVIMSLK